MWFRIAENGSVNGDAAASPFTAVSPLCHRGEFQHGESPFTAVTPPKRKTSPVITGHLITGYHAVMVTSFSALIAMVKSCKNVDKASNRSLGPWVDQLD